MDDDDETEFARLIPGVKRLRQDRINVYQQRRHQALKLKPATSAKNPSGPLAPTAGEAVKATHFNAGLQNKLQQKIRRGQIPPAASLDLHGCRQEEALGLLQAFIDDACRENLRLVLIIHGQGFRSQQDAVLKPLVQRWLAAQQSVLGWCPAQPRDGAAGATYVYLRSR